MDLVALNPSNGAFSILNRRCRAGQFVRIRVIRSGFFASKVDSGSCEDIYCRLRDSVHLGKHMAGGGMKKRLIIVLSVAAVGALGSWAQDATTTIEPEA